MNANFFRKLTSQEEADFRLWARQNYKPFDPINIIWHPIVVHECAAMNLDAWRKANA